MQISTTLSDHPVDDARLAEILANPGFGIHFTDHMFTVEWTPDRGWYDARITPYGPLSLDPATAVLHYAQETFEGMKAYRRDDTIWTFRPEENAARMIRSNRRLALPELPVESFVQAVDQLVKVEKRWVPDPAGEKSLYVRPFMIATEVFLGVRPAQHVTFMVIASPAGSYFKGGVQPVTLWLSEEYTRAGRGGTGAAKTGGNYASSLLPQQEALAEGCDQVVFLDGQEGKYVRRRPHHHAGDRHHPRGHHPCQHHRAGGQARPPGGGAEVLDRRVARGHRERPDPRDLRLRDRRRGDPGRRAAVRSRRRGGTAVDRPHDADPPGAGRHPVRPRRGHLRLDAPGLLARARRGPG
jgi:hypothetical protein